jgi:hypothetical protein
MRIFLVVLVLFSLIQQSFAIDDKIVALVDKTVITKHKLTEYKKVLKLIHPQEQNTNLNDTNFHTRALDSLIDDIILYNNVSSRMDINIPKENMQSFIEYLETTQKKPKGFFISEVKKRNISFIEFNKKIEIELIKNSMLSSSSSEITDAETVDYVIQNNLKPVEVSLKIISSDDTSNRIYKEFIDLRKTGIMCNSIELPQQASFATITDIQMELKELSLDTQALVKDTEVGKFTTIIKDSDNIKMYLVCQKDVKNLSENEMQYIKRMLGLKSTSYNLKKTLNQLRQASYIKIM